MSTFDGKACGRVALERSGVPVAYYLASEIDKPAMQIAKKNYPDIRHIGDVRNVSAKALAMIYPVIDLLIGGSPCQGFSFAGAQLNFTDPRSALFFHFVRLWYEVRELNPRAKFLLENVRMKKEYQDIISRYLGVEPVALNSNLVSAQNRDRLYWTNIEGYTPPVDLDLDLEQTVLETPGIPVIKSYDSLKYKPRKSQCLDANYHKGEDNRGQRTMIFNPAGITLKDIVHESRGEVFDLETYKIPQSEILRLFDRELERNKIQEIPNYINSDRIFNIHGIPVIVNPETPVQNGNYLFPCIEPERLNKFQNGPRFGSSKKFYTLVTGQKHGVLLNGYIRKLTPIECERLQTLPDRYTEGVSNSQRYKMLGNGWTIDAIVQFFKHLNKNPYL